MHFFLQTTPNALFILTDQQSNIMMSCMGNKWLKTPNLEYGFTLKGNIPYDGSAKHAENVLAEISKNPERKYIINEDYNGYQMTDRSYKYTIYELPGNPEILTDLQTNLGETKNFVNDAAYNEKKTQLNWELVANLSKRGLTPLPLDRTSADLKNLVNDIKGKKGESDSLTA